MNIFVDDVRDLPENFDICYRSCEAFWRDWFYRLDEINVLSLDHDMGLDEKGKEMMTGYKLLCKMEQRIATSCEHRSPREIRIHSSNPVGRVSMQQAIDSIYRNK